MWKERLSQEKVSIQGHEEETIGKNILTGWVNRESEDESTPDDHTTRHDNSQHVRQQQGKQSNKGTTLHSNQISSSIQ